MKKKHFLAFQFFFPPVQFFFFMFKFCFPIYPPPEIEENSSPIYVPSAEPTDYSSGTNLITPKSTTSGGKQAYGLKCSRRLKLGRQSNVDLNKVVQTAGGQKI